MQIASFCLTRGLIVAFMTCTTPVIASSGKDFRLPEDQGRLSYGSVCMLHALKAFTLK